MTEFVYYAIVFVSFKILAEVVIMSSSWFSKENIRKTVMKTLQGAVILAAPYFIRSYFEKNDQQDKQQVKKEIRMDHKTAQVKESGNTKVLKKEPFSGSHHGIRLWQKSEQSRTRRLITADMNHKKFLCRPRLINMLLKTVSVCVRLKIKSWQ